jgi:hypothetical protein
MLHWNADVKPSVEEVLEAGEHVLQQYINAIICSNEKYSSYYDKRPKTDLSVNDSAML